MLAAGPLFARVTDTPGADASAYRHRHLIKALSRKLTP